MTATGPALAAVDLPLAPPVVRVPPAPSQGRRRPALVLAALGVALVLGPIFGGLFAKAAAGQQMIDAFAPHMEADALARYRADLDILRRGALGLDAVYREQAVPAGRFPRLDRYRDESAAIDERAARLLARIEATEPDYRRVSAIGGFDRIPFLLVLSGAVAAYGAGVLLLGRRSRARSAIVVVALASLAVSLFPLVSGFDRGARAGHRLLAALGPVMDDAEVRQLQLDFVTVVEGVGELDTGFRQVPRTDAAGVDIDTLVQRWPRVSSDLAALVGVMNDNLRNFDALEGLDRLPGPTHRSGLEAFPWALVAVGLVGAALALASWPRLRREAT